MPCHSLCYQYVTLFASAFPLAAAVSIVFLFIEGRADLFKLLYVYQRPRVRRYDILHTSTLFIYYLLLFIYLQISIVM